MNILSIQSHVTFGHVGNSAAVFPLQRIGHEVWPVHTVNFSNHTGYGDWGGPLVSAADVSSIIDGIERRAAFERLTPLSLAIRAARISPARLLMPSPASRQSTPTRFTHATQ